jgi:hypothetical protein
MPLVERKPFDGRQKTKTFFLHAMNKSASAAAYGAIANSDVIEISIDFELNFTAVARAFVGLFHGTLP